MKVFNAAKIESGINTFVRLKFFSGSITKKSCLYNIITEKKRPKEILIVVLSNLFTLNIITQKKLSLITNKMDRNEFEKL